MTSIYQGISNKNLASSFRPSGEYSMTNESSTYKPVPTNLSADQYLSEIESLKKQLKSLEVKQDVIEAEKEELVNQVCDLKALMRRVGQECDRNLQRAEEKNKVLTIQVSSLEKALEVSLEHTGHLQDMADFWKLIDE